MLGGGQNVLNLTEEVCGVSDIRLKLRDKWFNEVVDQC